MRAPVRLLLAASLAASLGSCATGGGGDAYPPSMSAARAGLQPEYRLFYDALDGLGDWVLIEPYGWLFRPSISYHTWRPYEEGFWAPTDNFGWVWISSEPFGWATYHYGRWFRDDYQGWVWQPGLQWGPAWVDWQMAGAYVGWTPMLVADAPRPGGGSATSFAPIDQLGATDLSLRIRRGDDPALSGVGGRPIENQALRGGVLMNLGPPIETIERSRGPLTRVRIEDALGPAPGPSTEGTSATAPAVVESPTVTETRRAAERAAREAKTLRGKGGAPPAKLPMVRPVGERPPGLLERGLKRERPAPADTTKR